MKRTIPALAIALLFTIPAFAQHSVTTAWVASTTAGVTGYNVYRANCTGTISAGTCSAEGPFAKIGSTVAPTVTYTDTAVVAGGKYSYYFTATCPSSGCSSGVAGESITSVHVAAVVPQDTPLPPTSPSITTVSRNSTGANVSLSASWTCAPNVVNTYAFMSNGALLASGTQMNPTGSYVAAWAGKLKPGSPVIFTVCDKNNNCDSRTV